MAELPYYRSLFRTAPGPYLILAPDPPKFTIVEVNDAYLRVTNTTRDGIMGRALFDVFPDNPTDPDATGERNLRGSLMTVLATKQPHTMAVQKYDIPKPDSETGEFEERYWTPVNTPVLGDDGNVEWIIHNVEDVTEVARLSQASQQQGEAARVLRSRADWLEQEIVSRRIAESNLDEALERERTARGDAETARIEAERDRAAAEEANHAKSAFLAAMSHELRTPLNAIGGYAELMEMGLHGPITPEQRHDLDRIKRSEKYLLGLINDVLNFVKLETGHVKFEMAHVPVRQLLTLVEELVAPQLRAKKLRYSFKHCDSSLGAYGDFEKIRQVLVNLMANAVKYTEPGGEISVWCDGEPETVHFRVSDTGRGIAPDQLSSIFEPFVQLNRDLKTPAEGVGLGLAISRDLAEGMGGKLNVTSEIGKGSTFTLTLPRSRGS